MTVILTIIEKVQNGSLSSGSETSGPDFISYLIKIMNKLVMKSFDDEYYAAFSLIISVTNVGNLNADATQMLFEIGEIYKYPYYI